MWWQLLFLQVGFFVILLFALRMLFHGQLTRAVASIEKMRQKTLQKEQEIKVYQESVRKHFEEKTNGLDKELALKRAQAEKDVKDLKENALEELELKRNAMMQEVAEKETMLKRQVEGDVMRRAEIAAVGAVEKAFGSKLLETLHQELVGELLDSFEDMKAKKISLNGKSILIRTAFPLTRDQKETLKSRLFHCLEPRERAKEAAGITVHEEIDSALTAGFVVILDQVILDGSLKQRFHRILEGPK